MVIVKIIKVKLLPFSDFFSFLKYDVFLHFIYSLTLNNSRRTP
ncbi:hypothetical protein SXCC_01880 [Gluconacetobacter sp. SXCC-1]|nr:hypothetical protein SXCC_01880 [Gluconacetobacter sp. SXCC-1]